MKIDEKTVIKYFDIVLLADKKDSFFGIYRILSEKHFKTETREERDFLENLRYEIKEFSEFHGYFDFFPNGNCKLTEKGMDAKKKGGHLKYQNSLNKKIWYNENWVGFLIAIIVFLFSVYQYFENDSLKKKYDSLKSEYDSLKSEYDSLKSEYDSLKSEYDLYKYSVSDSKEHFELQKINSLKDTLQTKSLNDLKTE